MSTVQITKRMAVSSPRLRARFVVAYYMLTILTGALFFFLHGRLALAADLAAAVLYLGVTALLYGMSRSGNSTGRGNKEGRA